MSDLLLAGGGSEAFRGNALTEISGRHIERTLRPWLIAGLDSNPSSPDRQTHPRSD
jgi:hypothetical protein